MKKLADTVANKKVPALIIGEKGLLTSIAAADIPVILGHELKNSPALRSKYARFKVPFSSYDSPEFIKELCRLGKIVGGKMVIFSDDDRALLNISKNREKLLPYYLFSYPDNEIVEKLLDKQLFAELANNYDLPVPESYQIKSRNDLNNIAATISYPCIIKPTQRHHWWGNAFIETLGFYKKAIKCEDKNELIKTYKLISQINTSVVVQEYVEGEDDQHFSSNVFADDSGNIKGFYTAQKMRVYPVSAGTGTYIKTIRNKKVEQLTFDIVSKLSLKGLLNVQFKKDSSTGEYKLMEIHIRNSLWSLLGSKAGANLGEQYYNYLTSKTIHEDILIARPDVKYINLSHDILAALQYRRENKLTFYQWIKSLQGERVFALSSISDPLPAIYKIGKTIKNRVTLTGRKFLNISTNNTRVNKKSEITSPNKTVANGQTDGRNSTMKNRINPPIDKKRRFAFGEKSEY